MRPPSPALNVRIQIWTRTSSRGTRRWESRALVSCHPTIASVGNPRGFEAPPGPLQWPRPTGTSKVSRRNFGKRLAFCPWGPPPPPHVEETRLRYATRHLPMQKSVGPFRAICARSFGSAPVNWPCCDGLFTLLRTFVCNDESAFYPLTPPEWCLASWGRFINRS